MRTASVIDDVALDIAERGLEETRIALLRGEFDRFAPLFAIPHTTITPEGSVVLSTKEELRTMFERSSGFFRKAGAVDLVGRVESAFFSGDHLLNTYASQVVYGSGKKDDPFFCNSTMAKQNGRWVVTEAEYALGARKEHARALLAGRTPRSEEDSSARIILQEVLDDVTDAFLTRDLALFSSRTKFPFFLQGDDGTRILTSEDDLEAELRSYHTGFLVHEVTDVVRTVKTAQLIGDRRIHGTYRTHILSGTELVMDSYSSSLSLERGEDGVWRMTSVLHPLNHMATARKRRFPFTGGEADDD